jgi:hypothetical protein
MLRVADRLLASDAATRAGEGVLHDDDDDDDDDDECGSGDCGRASNAQLRATCTKETCISTRTSRLRRRRLALSTVLKTSCSSSSTNLLRVSV